MRTLCKMSQCSICATWATFIPLMRLSADSVDWSIDKVLSLSSLGVSVCPRFPLVISFEMTLMINSLTGGVCLQLFLFVLSKYVKSLSPRLARLSRQSHPNSYISGSLFTSVPPPEIRAWRVSRTQGQCSQLILQGHKPLSVSIILSQTLMVGALARLDLLTTLRQLVPLVAHMA